MAATITLKIDITNATITAVVLSASDASYGVKRDSDAAVIVADETAVTTVVTGSEYSYTSSLLNSSIAYTASWQVSYDDSNGDPQIEYVEVSIPAQIAPRSLLYLRRELSARLGGFGLYAAELDSDDRSVVAFGSAMIGTEDSADAFDGAWLLPVDGDNAGQQRRITPGGYDVTGGGLTLASALTALPVANTTYEIHSHLPATAASRIDGLREIINRALALLWTVKRMDFPSSATEFFSLSGSADWLVRSSQIINVYRPSDTSGTYRPYAVGLAYDFQTDGDNPTLVGPLNAEDGWQMDVVRPANTWIKVNGAWGDSQLGLQNDDDEQVLPPQVVVPVALYFAYQALAVAPWEGKITRADWERKALTWASIAAPIKRAYMVDVERDPGGQTLRYGPAWGTKGLF